MERAQAVGAQAGQADREGQVGGRLRFRGSSLTLYLDTNALIKLLIDEPGSEDAEDAMVEARTLAASNLGFVEVHSALARMSAGGRLTASAHREAIDRFGNLWAEVASVEVGDRMIADAAELSRRHRLRAYDAVHLAAAMLLKPKRDVTFACWDKALRDAATAEGLDLVPTEI